MSKIGYIRVSTEHQETARQQEICLLYTSFLICLLKMMKKRISWSSCQREEMRSLTKISPKRKLTLLPKMQKRCVLSIKNIPAESGFIISTRTDKRRLTDCQEQQIRLLFIRQMRLLDVYKRQATSIQFSSYKILLNKLEMKI